jgi:hypothetical protein
VHCLSSEVSLASATHALIVAHGKGGDAFNSSRAGKAGVNAAAKEGVVKSNSVVIVAPVFFNGKRFSQEMLIYILIAISL